MYKRQAYARGAAGRIQLVEAGSYQFAVCSQYAAEYAIAQGREIEIAMNFGPGSFLSKHVLVLGEQFSGGIRDGMRVGYDRDSLDQSEITKNLIKGKKVKLVDIRIQQTLSAIEDGVIAVSYTHLEKCRKNFGIRDIMTFFFQI